MAKLWRSLLGGRSSVGTEERFRLGEDGFADFSPAAFAAFKSYYTGSGIGRDRDRETIENNFSSYVTQLFKSDGIVFACMVARQLVFAEARFQYRSFKGGRPQALFDGPGLRVLEKPWPNGSSGELLARMLGDVDLSGNAYIVREGSRLRRLRPDWVQIIMTAPPDQAVQADVAGYAYFPGGIERGKPQFYLPEEMCHWSPIPDPDANYRGMSSLTPVVAEILADQAAVGHKLQFFRNGAVLGPIFRLGADVSIEKFREFVAAANAEHTGVDNAYKPLYVGGGADVTLATANMQQIDYRAVTGAGETRIAAVLRISPVIVGLSEGMQGSSLNAGNYGAAKRNFVDGTMRPLWRSGCAALENVAPAPSGAQLWYDDYDIPYLREDATDAANIGQIKASTIVSLSTGGFLRDSAVAAVENNYDMTLLELDPDWVSVQLQASDGSGGTASDNAAPPASRAVHADAHYRVRRTIDPLDDGWDWRAAATAEDEDPDSIELDPEEQVLSDALDILAASGFQMDQRAWDPSLHPRGPDGRFINVGHLLADAIRQHRAGLSAHDPFASYSRERLRRVAVRRGLHPPRGAGKDEIQRLLLNSVSQPSTPVPDVHHKPVPQSLHAPVRMTSAQEVQRQRAIDAVYGRLGPQTNAQALDEFDKLDSSTFDLMDSVDQALVIGDLFQIRRATPSLNDRTDALLDKFDPNWRTNLAKSTPSPTPTLPNTTLPTSPMTTAASNALYSVRDPNVGDVTKLAAINAMQPSDWASLSPADRTFLTSQHAQLNALVGGTPTGVSTPAPKYNAAQRNAVDMAQGTVGIGTSTSYPNRIAAYKGLTKADFEGLTAAHQSAIVHDLERIQQRTPSGGNVHRSAHSVQATLTGTPNMNTRPGRQANARKVFNDPVSTIDERLAAANRLSQADFTTMNGKDRGQVLANLNNIATLATQQGDDARKLLDRFNPAGLPTNRGKSGTPTVAQQAIFVPADVKDQQHTYVTPQTDLLTILPSAQQGRDGDGNVTLANGQPGPWGKYGASGVLLRHVDDKGVERFLMAKRGSGVSDPGKWQFPGGARNENETPAQGAAREVHEEIGIPADALAAARVHGFHQSSLPGTNWSYTSYAADVDSQIAPNMNASHAWETADARWLTVDEINKLDAKGELLEPLASGQLHTKVRSLFPPPTPTGSPNQPRAPKHKASTGTHLLKSNIDRTNMYATVNSTRGQYRGKTADEKLAALGAMQGYDKPPTVVTKDEFAKLLASGDYHEAWRGVHDSGSKTAADIAEDMRSGPAYYGNGIYGNGYYMSHSKDVAEMYAGSRTRGRLIHILIPKTAKTDRHDRVENRQYTDPDVRSRARGSLLNDAGRFAAAEGLDGIEIPHSIGGGAVARPGGTGWNWLNRAVLIIEEA